MSACYSLFLFAFAFLVFSCTKTTVAPTRQVSSSTKHLDRHINAALKRESIQPSKMSEDAEFLRRVHLDLTGKIPTPEEVLDFLKDGSSNKRQKKIDLLLDSDVYLDYWSGLWVNWLIGRREDGDDRRIGLTFWVRDALTKNMPYNQFVQELIAAVGELRDNGAGNYIMRYNRSPVFLTSHTTRLFLGLPMQCAECHDHKTEAWNQEDFYGIAAFFAGIDSQRKGSIQTMDMAGNERRMNNFLITNKPEDAIWVERLEKQVGPHFLDGTEYKGSFLKKREALAQWMTDKSNPYFSQAIVNRIWKRFMGRAFVEPVDGFGEENQPTNPELLKSLAKDFVIYSYDLQHLMRTILNSEAYQRTSQTNESNKDDQLYYSHAYVKPLSAEQFFYSVLQATGFERLQQVRMKGSKKQGGEDRKGMLRQLERMKREHLKKFLFLLDNGEMEEIEAFNGTVPQALMMINGNMVNDSASHEARGGFVNYVLEKWRGPIERVEYIYLNVLSRLPTAKEKTYFRRYLERSLYRNKDLAYEDLYWVLLNSAEFSLNH
jgi:hypothetical protein